MAVSAVVILLLTLALTVLRPARGGVAEGGCGGLAAFRLTLETFWSREDFPKQYPLYRPAAQWSKLVGRTHSAAYRLWTENETVSEAVRQFAEGAVSTLLDGEAQGGEGVFDAFTAPALSGGVGRTRVHVYAEQRYSKLSMIVHMIPSPDWFVGVSGLDLCSEVTGRWIERISLDLHPMDAGTDRGLTFSAPNWAEDVPLPVTRITSRQPSHPASSFYYPELSGLKRIARMSVERVTFEDVIERGAVSPRGVSSKKSGTVGQEESGSYKQERISGNGEPGIKSSSLTGMQAMAPSSVQQLQQQQQQQQLQQQQQQQQHQQLKPKTLRSSNTVEKNKPENLRKFADAYAAERVDCEVGAWTDWSPCSKTCGFGLRTRTRAPTRPARGGGRPCPVLTEEETCGSMRGCNWKHFSQTNWEGAKEGKTRN